MERQGYSLSMRKIEDKWIAAFHHDPTLSAGGFGSGTTPWRAVQDAAYGAEHRGVTTTVIGLLRRDSPDGAR